MAAPLVAVKSGAAVVDKVATALKNDIVEIKGQWFHKVVLQEAHRKSKKYPDGQKEIIQYVPIEYDVHVNPVSLATVGGAVAVAAFAGWLLWNGIAYKPIYGDARTLVPAFRDSRYGKKITDRLAKRDDLARQKADCLAAGGRWNPLTKSCDLGTPASCARLKAEYDAAVAASSYTDAARAKYQARFYGCAWAR